MRPLCHLLWKSSTAFVSPVLENLPGWSLHPISSYRSQSCQSEPSELQLGTSSAPFYCCLLLYPLPLAARVCSHYLWSSSSSFSLGILHPWRYLKVEHTALKVTLFQARVGVRVSRGALHPKLFHDFAIRLNSNGFLHKRHQSKVTY